MWARIKGKAENALLRLPFKAAYVLRPGAIRPMHGIKSSTPSYRIAYGLLAPILPFLERQLPQYVTSTEQVGRAMLALVRSGSPKRILECADINRL